MCNRCNRGVGSPKKVVVGSGHTKFKRLLFHRISESADKLIDGLTHTSLTTQSSTYITYLAQG